MVGSESEQKQVCVRRFLHKIGYLECLNEHLRVVWFLQKFCLWVGIRSYDEIAMGFGTHWLWRCIRSFAVVTGCYGTYCVSAVPVRSILGIFCPNAFFYILL